MNLSTLSRFAFLLLALPALAQSDDAKKKIPAAPASAAAFAPLPKDHELASVWNDPDFARRLIGSYGFASEAEPRMTPEEQALYRKDVVPLLTNSDPKKALAKLQELAKPNASAVFDFTLGNVYFNN